MASSGVQLSLMNILQFVIHVDCIFYCFFMNPAFLAVSALRLVSCSLMSLSLFPCFSGAVLGFLVTTPHYYGWFVIVASLGQRVNCFHGVTVHFVASGSPSWSLVTSRGTSLVLFWCLYRLRAFTSTTRFMMDSCCSLREFGRV